MHRTVTFGQCSQGQVDFYWGIEEGRIIKKEFSGPAV